MSTQPSTNHRGSPVLPHRAAPLVQIKQVVTHKRSLKPKYTPVKLPRLAGLDQHDQLVAEHGKAEDNTWSFFNFGESRVAPDQNYLEAATFLEEQMGDL